MYVVCLCRGCYVFCLSCKVGAVGAGILEV